MAKQLELLESRVEGQYARLNSHLTAASELQGQVDGLRREKLAFESAYKCV